MVALKHIKDRDRAAAREKRMEVGPTSDDNHPCVLLMVVGQTSHDILGGTVRYHSCDEWRCFAILIALVVLINQQSARNMSWEWKHAAQSKRRFMTEVARLWAATATLSPITPPWRHNSSHLTSIKLPSDLNQISCNCICMKARNTCEGVIADRYGLRPSGAAAEPQECAGSSP